MNPPSPVERTAAHDWLKSFNVIAPPEDQVDNVLKQWRIWNAATSLGRETNLALELKRISPSQENSNVVSLDRRQDLKSISRANLDRLKEKIAARIPLADPAEPLLLEQVKSMNNDIAFHYLHPLREKSDTGLRAPLASARELARLGLDFSNSFYSHLIGRSPSVPFKIVAAKAKTGPLSLESQIPSDAIRLNDELAQEAGFVLPDFQSVNALMAFFNEWEPELIEKVRRENRMSLPSSVADAQSFLIYLDPARVQEVFPATSTYERLSTLRERLINYALTEPDTKELLHWAFERWLMSVAANEPREFDRIQREFRLPTGPQAVFFDQFLPRLGLPNLALRVPLAVGPQSYSILHIENATHNPFPRDFPRPPNKWDSRRLDHESKP